MTKCSKEESISQHTVLLPVLLCLAMSTLSRNSGGFEGENKFVRRLGVEKAYPSHDILPFRNRT